MRVLSKLGCSVQSFSQKGGAVENLGGLCAELLDEIATSVASAAREEGMGVVAGGQFAAGS